ncbi:hypothetical protein [Roseomonas sp. USHLN139]|uniref:hypothetical protein n=1 Tax=Roseomonas sp. USHLN139 TaxID=3081298 RepID=UPI003B02B02D
MALRLVPHLGTVNGVYRAELAGQIAATASPRPMDAYEFGKALRVIRWSPGEAAGQLNLADSTIRKMASGNAKVPDDIAAWLRAYASELAGVHARHPPPRRQGRPGP